MNQYGYENEALDAKLCLLRFTKNIWIPVVAALAGAVLCAGIYILTHHVFGPAKEYRIEDEYYVEYAKEESGEEYVYFNQMTWSLLADTDYFLDTILEGMSQPIDRAELEEYIDATLLSDTRIVTTSVTAPSTELAEEIHGLYRNAFLAFKDEYKEIESISLIKEGSEAKMVVVGDRSVRAAVLGAVLGLVLSVFCMYLYVVADDSVYLPITLEKRYGISTKVWEEKAEFPKRETEGIIQGKNNDGYYLWVRAGAHNGTRVEKLMLDAKKEGKEVNAAYLVEPDNVLIKIYNETQNLLL